MALLFCDSADHYTTIAQKYPSNSGFSIGAGLGRFGTSALVCGGSSGTKSFTYAVSPAKQTLIIGFAYLHITAVGARGTCYLLDGATTHMMLAVNASGQFYLSRAGSVTLATGSAVLIPDVYYWLELRVKVDDAAGEYELRVNGVTDIGPVTGADTRNAAAAQITAVSWQSPGNITGGSRFDDIYVCDTLGGAADTFLGEIRVQALLPNGNGASSVFVGNDGNSTDNYLLVDEAAPNSDTDYVEANTVGDKDTYAYGNLVSTAGTVYGVQVLPFAEKTDAGARSIVSVARSGGTEVDSAAKALLNTYGYLPDIRMTKPGGGAWSVSDINAAEFGVKVSA